MPGYNFLSSYSNGTPIMCVQKLFSGCVGLQLQLRESDNPFIISYGGPVPLCICVSSESLTDLSINSYGGPVPLCICVSSESLTDLSINSYGGPVPLCICFSSESPTNSFINSYGGPVPLCICVCLHGTRSHYFKAKLINKFGKTSEINFRFEF